MGTLTIRIDDELENDLEQLAKSQHRTKSDLAREMLRKRVAVERFRELRRKALPLAEATPRGAPNGCTRPRSSAQKRQPRGSPSLRVPRSSTRVRPRVAARPGEL